MSLWWAVVALVVIDAVAIAAILVVRRRAPEGSFFTDGDRASGVFGVLATGFAIFAGFVIFLVFTSYDQSRAGAETEALVVAQQFETAQFLAPATRDRLAGQLVCWSTHCASSTTGTAGRPSVARAAAVRRAHAAPAALE